ncbi:hypothetical protein N9D42_02605 [Candidatus Thioglobus sp.]|nr:hypothetical protein [Candidatus Thioglobus sp.]
MAKLIMIEYEGKSASFQHSKVDRSKLYGSRKRLSLDPSGESCQRCELSDDGSTLIMSGMTSQGYFDDGTNWIPNNELVGMDFNGNVLEKAPATLGVAQETKVSELESLLDLSVDSIYQLEPEEVSESIQLILESGKVLNFPFNYRADYHAESAYLILNKEGYFLLIGNPVQPQWMDLEQIAVESFEEDSEDNDDLDFEMF